MKTRFLIFAVWILTAATASGAQYSLDPSAGTDSVFFRSTAKLEFIEGKTNDITGTFTVDPARADSGITGTLRVDLRTLKTGIDTRDGHMRDRHLRTDKYPYAFFEVTGVKGIPTELTADRKYNGTVEGWFYIHGVKRRLEAPIEVTRTEESGRDKLTVRTNFQIKLDEYAIPRPKALFLKLAETINVECIFSGYNNLSGLAIDLPNWPETQ